MGKISDILLSPGQGAYYCEDVRTLQEHSIPDEKRWTTPGKTPGFSNVRQLADVVSVGLRSGNGNVSWGDCLAVSYGGKSGRKGLFRHAEGIQALHKKIVPLLRGSSPQTFRSGMALVFETETHPAIQYGVSQALLSYFASEKGKTPTEIICAEWGLALPTEEVPLQGSSGNERKTNADKMIVNRLAALPHGQIDDIASQLGFDGAILLDYARWLRARIRELAPENYFPQIHLDVHGAVGKIFSGDPTAISTYLTSLEKVLAPFPLRMESVILAASKAETIDALLGLRAELARRGSQVEIVADEWANTLEDIVDFAAAGAVDMVHIKMPDLGGIEKSVEAVLRCRDLGVKSLLGGSCAETEISTRISVAVAMATRPQIFLAKPGMGIDEAIMLCKNEMRRTLAALPAK